MGIEGGVVEAAGRLDAHVRVGGDRRRARTHGRRRIARDAAADRVAAMIRGGVELGHAMDRLIGAHNTKHGAGAVGILTAGSSIGSARMRCS